MTRGFIYPTRLLAERTIDALTEAHAPSGVETVRVVSRGRVVSEETRPAKRWAEPVELEDGRFAVPVSPRKLAGIADREVTVGGQRVRVPRADEAVDLETEELPDGHVIVRERRERPLTPRAL